MNQGVHATRLIGVFLGVIMSTTAAPIIGSDSGGTKTGVSIGEEGLLGEERISQLPNQV
jgi:hypothetical protein